MDTFLANVRRRIKADIDACFFFFSLDEKKKQKKSRLSKKKAKNFMTGQKRNELAVRLI